MNLLKVRSKLFLLFYFVAGSNFIYAQSDTPGYRESYRPQVHFSPKAHWMNDPNGMVYHKGIYHLFFQYYPKGTTWGPMHWGHATSRDMIHWKEQPIALYPDSLGFIFSGSVVSDENNTSGFGKKGQSPLIAIFTHHNWKLVKAGQQDFQYQSIAYSVDEGKTWTKYADNPVVKNPGIKDFRDPKVMWYEKEQKWVMTLATKDRITFYSSPDLKNWSKESEFGQNLGAHGGVWECPDLFPLDVEGKTIWVLLVSINPGGPNGGSATQYFTGQFDGNKFTPNDTVTRWIDYGPDNYAGVTWSNTGKRKLFIGWMNNWDYANLVPTQKWRGATTIPRELTLQKVADQYLISSIPVKELRSIEKKPTVYTNVDASRFDFAKKSITPESPLRIAFSSEKIESFAITFSNDSGEKLVIGYDKASNQYFIDRSSSGKVNFKAGFAGKHFAPRLIKSDKVDMTLIVDKASVELFADGGLTVMTEVFFPNSPYSKISINADNKFKISKLQCNHLMRIW